MDKVIVTVNKVNNKVELPSWGSTYATCFDLKFQPTKDYVDGYDRHNNPVKKMLHNTGVDIYAGERLLIPTGLIFKLEFPFFSSIEYQTYSIRLHARSGLSLKKGLVLANGEGIVDIDYQNEIFVLLTNISERLATIEYKERIAQAEIVQNIPCQFVLSENKLIGYSERNGGFGSTGAT